MGWFRTHWAGLAPWLPLVELRDQEDRRIDGGREAFERNLKKWTNLE
jgi:hypothetical protein